jgi:hypothetical protein
MIRGFNITSPRRFTVRLPAQCRFPKGAVFDLPQRAGFFAYPRTPYLDSNLGYESDELAGFSDESTRFPFITAAQTATTIITTTNRPLMSPDNTRLSAQAPSTSRTGPKMRSSCLNLKVMLFTSEG